MRFAFSLPLRHCPTVVRMGVLLCGTAVFFLGAPAANAQISFTLTYSSATTNANSEAYFYGTIANNSTTTTYYLNGLDLRRNAGTTDNSFTTDSSPFDTYTNSNPTLAPGASYTGQLFGVQTNSSFNTMSQFYGTATLEGGTNDTALGNLGIQNFYVSASAMPEPSALALLGSGLTAGLFFSTKSVT